MVRFRWIFEIFAKKISQGWLNTLEIFFRKAIILCEKIFKKWWNFDTNLHPPDALP